MNQQKTSLPNDAAQLCLWRTGMQAPTVFVVEAREAENVLTQYADGADCLEFKSYQDGSGRRSTTAVRSDALDGVTVEAASLRITGVMPNA